MKARKLSGSIVMGNLTMLIDTPNTYLRFTFENRKEFDLWCKRYGIYSHEIAW